MKANRVTQLISFVSIMTTALVVSAAPLGTAFTYQGRLSSGTEPANGSYDLKFELYDGETSTIRVGGPVTNTAVNVANGLFTTAIDVGASLFSGDALWIELSVRPNGDSGDFTKLSPRQVLAPAPYALYAPAAGTAATLPAANITGTVSVDKLPSNLALLDGAQTFSGANVLNNPENVFTGSGAGLTSLNASSLSSGTVPNGRLSGIYTGVIGFMNSDNYFSGYGGDLTGVNADRLQGLRSTNFWKINGNSATIAGTHFLGTTDNRPLDFKVNGERMLRLEYATNTSGNPRPNVIGGYQSAVSTYGSTIGGGYNNTVLGNAYYSTIAGGRLNSIANGAAYSAIGGGDANTISGSDPSSSFIGGGYSNTIAGASYDSVIGGGYLNLISGNAEHAVIGGGMNNTNTGAYATVPGGYRNFAASNHTFAAGYRAKALHQGAFVWADSQDANWSSTVSNSFIVRAQNGVGINRTTPTADLHVGGTARVEEIFSLGRQIVYPEAGSTITPTASHVALVATSPITLNIVSAIGGGAYTGQILIIEGRHDVNTVTIPNNANTRMGGQRTLGQNDTLMLIWNSTDWLELGYNNNIPN